jgi:dihydrofolate reductase
LWPVQTCRCLSLPTSLHRPKPCRGGPSNLTFVTDGIVSAVEKARVAHCKDIKLGGASPGKAAIAASACDEMLVHVAPYLLGGGVRLFDALPDGIRLEKLRPPTVLTQHISLSNPH